MVVRLVAYVSMDWLNVVSPIVCIDGSLKLTVHYRALAHRPMFTCRRKKKREIRHTDNLQENYLGSMNAVTSITHLLICLNIYEKDQQVRSHSH